MKATTPPTEAKHPSDQLRDFLLNHNIQLNTEQLKELFDIGLAYWQKGYGDCAGVLKSAKSKFNLP